MDAPIASAAPIGRHVVMAIGIDQYRAWGELRNAVNDARGVTSLFRELGFQELIPPLTNQAATFTALRKLVVTDLRRQLREDDALVLFFAGHGHTETASLQGTSIRVGYIIPVDGDAPGGDAGSWLELESWLKDVARLPPRHILVILDSCHSGMALELSRTRGAPEPHAQLLARRSRRVITSAQDTQQALDDGPARGHSLFTGLLLQALRGEVATEDGAVTGAELASHLRRRVSEHRPAQTPDFGALPLLDAGGDLVFSLAARPRQIPPGSPPAAIEPSGPGGGTARPPARPRVIALALSGTAVLVILLAILVGGTSDVSPGGDRSTGTHRDSGTDSGSNLGTGGPSSPEAGPTGARPAPPPDAPSVAPPDVAPPDARRTTSVDCYRPPTGGVALRPSDCPPSSCAVPDPAMQNNERYRALRCQRLCTCP